MAILSEKAADYIRAVWSGSLTLFGMIVMTAATLDKFNLFWPSVPPYIQIPFLVCDILLLGTLEGIQISLVALKNHNTEAFKESHPRAYKTNKLCQQGRNLERFLMGRQVFVVVTVFFGSYITTQSEDFKSLFGWDFPGWVGTAFFQTGLMGVLVVAIFGQLMVQVVASAYPINFMEVIPWVYPVLVGCLFFEDLGFVYLCYWVADVFMHITGLKKPDDHSITPLRKRGFSHIFSESILKRAKSLARVRSRPSSAGEMNVVPYSDRSAGGNDARELSNHLVEVVSELKAEQDNDVMVEAMRRYPHLFNNFPRMVGGKVYASPQQVQQYIRDQGYSQVPGFLQPTSHSQHVPPHAFVCSLLKEQQELRKQLGDLGQEDMLQAFSKVSITPSEHVM